MSVRPPHGHWMYCPCGSVQRLCSRTDTKIGCTDVRMYYMCGICPGYLVCPCGAAQTPHGSARGRTAPHGMSSLPVVPLVFELHIGLSLVAFHLSFSFFSLCTLVFRFLVSDLYADEPLWNVFLTSNIELMVLSFFHISSVTFLLSLLLMLLKLHFVGILSGFHKYHAVYLATVVFLVHLQVILKTDF